jgi:predicted nucleotidyltransferase
LTATQIRERLADLATERPEVALVVLFGSTARNRAGRDSAASGHPCVPRA